MKAFLRSVVLMSVWGFEGNAAVFAESGTSARFSYGLPATGIGGVVAVPDGGGTLAFLAGSLCVLAYWRRRGARASDGGNIPRR